ncbi:protease modulator HflK [Parasphingorhabdus sp. DH2-15]|uniref:protease modulator HflK n=1 Tax=Parasphingorhabdus sp. DH2-15 TaxID=3444112 RepID=UPI003F68960A
MASFSKIFSQFGSFMASGSPWGDGPTKGGSGGPNNPWQPSGSSNGSGKKGTVEDLFRNRSGGGGPNGGGGGMTGMPKMPDSKKFIPLALIGIAIFWILSTSIWRLGPQEQGVVKFLGSYSRTVGPGINWTLPMPFETMEKVDTQAIRETSIGTASANDGNFVLTSDQNIIDMAYEVRWSVRDPELYLFQLEGPDGAVEATAESSMRAVIANFSLDDAIGPARTDIEAQVRQRMQEILDDYRAGVLIQGITIRQSDPPKEVNEAFKQVNVAQQQAETSKNDARAYASRLIERAKGETSRFDQVYEQYRLAPEVTRQRLYYETLEAVLGKVDKTIVEAGNVTPYLPLPELRRRADSIAQPTVPAPTQPSTGQGEQ